MIERYDLNEEWAHAGLIKAGDFCFLGYCVGNVGGTIEEQVNGAFDGIEAEELTNIVVAYEPVWAIGTGKTATSEQAEETIKNIRSMVAKLYGRKLANKLRIQYGGSMNPKNVSELMAQPNIDGGLIGGASLKAVDFSQVVNY